MAPDFGMPPLENGAWQKWRDTGFILMQNDGWAGMYDFCSSCGTYAWEGHIAQESEKHRKGVARWGGFRNFDQKLSHALWYAHSQQYSEQTLRQLCHDPATLAEVPDAVAIFERNLAQQIRNKYRKAAPLPGVPPPPPPPPGIAAAPAAPLAALSLQDCPGCVGQDPWILPIADQSPAYVDSNGETVVQVSTIEQMQTTIVMQNETIAAHETRIQLLEERLGHAEKELAKLPVDV